MKKIAIVFDHDGGQTEKIARSIADTIRKSAAEAETLVVGKLPRDSSLDRYDAVVVGGAIHGGRHSRQLVKFIRRHIGTFSQIPSYLFSVSLSAAGKTERQQQNAARCVDGLLRETNWQPRKTITVAGALRYSEYNPLMRWLMKRLARKEGGDTDVSRDYEYTDWTQVGNFARQCLDDLHGAWNSRNRPVPCRGKPPDRSGFPCFF